MPIQELQRAEARGDQSSPEVLPPLCCSKPENGFYLLGGGGAEQGLALLQGCPGAARCPLKGRVGVNHPGYKAPYGCSGAVPRPGHSYTHLLAALLRQGEGGGQRGGWRSRGGVT